MDPALLQQRLRHCILLLMEGFVFLLNVFNTTLAAIQKIHSQKRVMVSEIECAKP